MSPDEIHSRIVTLGEDWADKECAASLLEETRKTIRAQIACRFLSEGSVSKAKLLAEAHDEYAAHIESMVNARKAANKAKVNFDAAKIWAEMERTAAATRRAEMALR